MPKALTMSRRTPSASIPVVLALAVASIVGASGTEIVPGPWPDLVLESDLAEREVSTKVFLDPVELTVVESSVTIQLAGQSVSVVGEARNDSDLVVGLLRLDVAGLDAEGGLVGTGSGWLQAGPGVSSLGVPGGQAVAPGETVWFSASLDATGDRTVAEVMVRVRGRGLFGPAGSGPSLELVDGWQVEADGWLHTLTGTVRSSVDEDVVGLSAAVALRDPTGSLIAISRSSQRGERIGGFLGGVRSGAEAEAETGFWVDPAVFDSATVETRLNAFTLGDPSHRYAVIGVAHRPGLGGTSWRSSLGLVNRSGAAARVLMTYRHDSGRSSVWVDLEDGEALHRDDAAVELFGVEGESAGTVLITSTTPLMVSGRTSNEGPVGGYGQALPVVTPAMSYGLEQGLGRTGVLSVLRGGPSFRTNIGLVNMGDEACSARVRLFDGNGGFVAGWGWVELARTEWRQVNRAVPDQVETAYAVVERDPGCPVWAYASIIDEATGDPTTVVLEPWTEVDLWPDRNPGMLPVIPWADHDDDPLPP
ncbi:MAG TPA: hypothetical protein VLT32_14075 [Candidatus Sulfomarinibacteraceae bacterium]|nr:hypothetical protein [Candidatus Sulfomarinibacteraceae bacterium]